MLVGCNRERERFLLPFPLSLRPGLISDKEELWRCNLISSFFSSLSLSLSLHSLSFFLNNGLAVVVPDKRLLLSSQLLLLPLLLLLLLCVSHFSSILGGLRRGATSVCSGCFLPPRANTLQFVRQKEIKSLFSSENREFPPYYLTFPFLSPAGLMLCSWLFLRWFLSVEFCTKVTPQYQQT